MYSKLGSKSKGSQKYTLLSLNKFRAKLKIQTVLE